MGKRCIYCKFFYLRLSTEAGTAGRQRSYRKGLDKGEKKRYNGEYKARVRILKAEIGK